MTFDGDGKITRIRQSWDQGSLLKQVEVIGRSGQNWPIRDSKEQISLIARCVKGDAAVISSSGPGSGPGPGSTESLPTRSRGGSTNVLQTSLDLFAPREEQEESSPPTVVSPKAGTRPRQRSFTEILGDEPVGEPGSPSDGRGRSQSPGKVVGPKVGSHLPPARLFEPDEDDAASDARESRRPSERYVRPDPKKYQHFEFDDGSEAQEAPAPKPAPARKNRHDSSWSFEDFVTPEKPIASRGMHRARDVRHWGTDEDGVAADDQAQKAPAAKPRRDAEAHFELVDDGPVSKEPREAGRRPAHKAGLQLYENRLHIDDDAVPSPEPPALGNITNLKDRRKDFEAHFALTDESPKQQNNGAADPAARVPESRRRAARMMESSWAPYDESPVSNDKKSNPAGGRGIAIAGDGMGGRKGSSRAWFTGEDEEEEKPVRKTGRRGPPTKSDNFWEF